jgi:hypothetical protein
MPAIIYKGKNMSYIERMTEEYKELIDKQDKLEKFIVSDGFNELEAEDQRLLFSQTHAMAAYSEILSLRIKRS